ncbi:hypothetical protein DZ985_05585 [Acinetobacter sp. JW]|nr:hypothetical protein DZ985_05585 [Acinetobacter sp. JW]
MIFNGKIKILKFFINQLIIVFMRKANNKISFNMKKSYKYGKKRYKKYRPNCQQKMSTISIVLNKNSF